METVTEPGQPVENLSASAVIRAHQDRFQNAKDMNRRGDPGRVHRTAQSSERGHPCDERVSELPLGDADDIEGGQRRHMWREPFDRKMGGAIWWLQEDVGHQAGVCIEEL